MILSYSPHEKTPTCFRTTELDSRAWWRPQGGAQGAQIRNRGEILWENSCEKMLIIGENMEKHGENMGKHGETWENMGKAWENMGTSLAKISNIFRIRIGHRGKIS